MCIVSFHFAQHPKYKLIVAANRDEFYRRPTKGAHFWEDEPYILAGRDLEAKGTWLGITKEGRFAALTNFRDPKYFDRTDKRSRGEIVTNFLKSKDTPLAYLEKLHAKSNQYNGFNILLGTPDELYYYGNEEKKIKKIKAGTHSLSNALLNTPWPKVIRAKRLLKEYVTKTETVDPNILFQQLHDQTKAPDHALPNTGIGLTLERDLSPIFIRTDDYGTRCSTVILVTKDNKVEFFERTFNDGEFKEERAFQFNISE